LCQRQARILLQGKSQLDAAGLKLVLISNGTPQAAQKFVTSMPYYGELYLDEGSTTYRAIGLKRLGLGGALSRFFSPKSISKTKAIFKAEPASDMSGDGNQTGGVAVLGPGPTPPSFLWRENDHPVDQFCSPEEVLAAVGSGAAYGGPAPAYQPMPMGYYHASPVYYCQ